MAKRYIVALALALAGCDFSLRAGGIDGGVVADAQGGEAPIDAFVPPVCPPSYSVTIGSSKYAITPTNRMMWTQSDLCDADAPGSTHLVILETIGEAMALRAQLLLQPAQPQGSRYFIGAVQDPMASGVEAGWITFAGAPLDPALWSNFGTNLVEPDDNGNLVEDGEEQIAVFDLTVTQGYLVDLSGRGNSGAVCECDGRSVAPQAAQYLADDPNRPPAFNAGS